MKIKDYFETMKGDFFQSLMVDNFESQPVAEELYNFMLNWTTELDAVRHSRSQTKKIFDNIDAVDLKLILYAEHWLMKAVQNEPTAVYAYNFMAQRINRKAYEVIMQYPIANVDEKELLKRLKKEEEYSPHFRCAPDLMRNIFEISSKETRDYGKIMDCSDEDFFRAIETADFSHLNVKVKIKVQHLIYSLSSKMGEKWYGQVVASLGWEKRYCSGLRGKLEFDKWAEELDLLLPPK
ncbi:hypothetical protein INQ51_08470 [Maribellus sp. CM-23]|uniref:hypothetical protein n=1 Tax=Maribellus sp. CM-23 TaxID=2781026 RepID=UPI001F3CBF79|nr:hypothetical protein [Maribellus sp. CM-23]MCE4564344.1 hypothetical protein [Maribellus sp. CM-23]